MHKMDQLVERWLNFSTLNFHSSFNTFFIIYLNENQPTKTTALNVNNWLISLHDQVSANWERKSLLKKGKSVSNVMNVKWYSAANKKVQISRSTREDKKQMSKKSYKHKTMY